MKFFIQRAYKNAYKVLAQTPEMKEEISDYHAINKKKIVVFLNPIDTDDIDHRIKLASNPSDFILAAKVDQEL